MRRRQRRCSSPAASGPRGTPSPPSGTTPAPRSPQSGPLNINTATAAQLETLDGIGPVLAQRIVDYRETNGPFASVEGLLEVKGLGPGILEAIRPQITAEEEP